MALIYYLASHNPIKFQEYQQLLAMWGVTLKPFAPDERIESVETENTYLDNARIKGQTYSTRYPKRLVLADDSGLLLQADPIHLGIHTARELAQFGDATQQNQAILTLLKGKERTFTMTSVLTLMQNGTELGRGIGTLTGEVAFTERGRASAGFDRLLIPEGTKHTLAERPFLLRRPYLHRYRALVALYRERPELLPSHLD
ncbi:MAG: non-canonical purine NTP pyrophosphatase [Aerococcus sp.]|nr:non-canonical purine NTP pyrophosphatase [Aerococcus sp.]